MASSEVLGKLHQIAVEDIETNTKEEGYIASAENQDFGEFFGRDAVLTSKFKLFLFEQKPYKVELLLPVRSTLRTMALHQGTVVNNWRDEEPGKTLHELRYRLIPNNQKRLEELKQTGWPVEVEEESGNLSMRYYGSVDSTPLFVDVASQYFTLTGDSEFFKWIDPHMRKALEWIENYGDMCGDGYVRFRAKNRFALLNQGWMDSGDSLEIAPNKRPREPIALVEVQGYTYSALVNAAEAYRSVGEFDYAKHLYQRAGLLKKRFNEEFWMENEGFFAYALDGDNNQVQEIRSNVGHVLMSGIIDEEKIPKVVNRIMQSDMFTLYGIRTLSFYSPNFSDQEPSAYHNGGGVWGHDNGIIYMGLSKTGYLTEAEKVGEAIVRANWLLYTNYGLRDSELHMVTKKGRLRPYKTAQHPQTWAGATNEVVTELSLTSR